MIYKSIMIFSALVVIIACAPASDFPSIDFLEGEWRVDGERRYEVWEKKGDYHFIGHGYVIDTTTMDFEKVITENLSIKMDGKNLVYEATVPNQNEGEAVPFVYNATVTDRLSFENSEHDFPKKIQYGFPKEGSMHIWVLGENDQGFDFDMHLQD